MWYLVRHPGDETGLRGILGHLSSDMLRVYTHLAHELIAQRAGRVSLSEAWLGDGEEPDQPTSGNSHMAARSTAPSVQQIAAALKSDPDLRKALLDALGGAA